MNKIVLEKNPLKQMKTKRHSVVINNETYLKLMKIQMEIGGSMESLVNKLMAEAVDAVEIKE